MSEITPCLWCDGTAEAQAATYTALFPDGCIQAVGRDGAGAVLLVEFRLAGLRLAALNAGPDHRPNPSISLCVECPDAATARLLWEGLAAGGRVIHPFKQAGAAAQGWLSDRYGVSWQVAVGGAGWSVAPALLFTGPRLGQAEAALRRYARLFGAATPPRISRHPAHDRAQAGLVQQARLRLAGISLIASDSVGPHPFGFTPGVSLAVACPDQRRLDALWGGLLADGGTAWPCGWITDGFGLSWQLVPAVLRRALIGGRRAVAARVMAALMDMDRPDLAALEAAAGLQ